MRLNPLTLISFKSKLFLGLSLGVILTSAVVYVASATMKATSTDEYCESCHVHPHSTTTWKQGAHYKNESGVVVSCIECHLPPDGVEHVVEKAKAGARDLYGFYFKDVSTIDWEVKSTLDEAAHFTFEASCLSCHQELFPVNLTDKGIDAHLHYRKNREEVRCINCHLKTGHFHDEPDEQFIPLEEEEYVEEEMAPLITELAPGDFVDYTEVIPGSGVKFEMIAIEGGTFLMGTAPDEYGHEPDEGPQAEVQISSFWMGAAEVSWSEFDSYYAETVTRGKNELGEISDAITGPTPPYGSPDQGWGKGRRPAITMSHYAARKYCEWLSKVTGRTYRLPTEAEWEYAARAGSPGPFPFLEEVSESWFDRWQSTLFGGAPFDEALLDEYASYRANSRLKTYPAKTKKPNPLGLYNMYGNVWEFCADRYDPGLLSSYLDGQTVKDPTGPSEGDAYVIRGGSFKSELDDLRSGARAQTRESNWLRTDPQTPKSVWWYSDSNDVGFRVVRVNSSE